MKDTIVNLKNREMSAARLRVEQIFTMRKHLKLAWSSSWTKPNVSAPTQPIGGVERPTLFNGLG
jgi:hypothetical protein